jgi:hypothetical protein
VDQDFLRRVRKTSVITGLVLAVVIAARWNLGAGIGWLVGCVWSLVNLYVIAVLVRTTMSGGKNRMRLGMVLALKVPVLYAVGFALLTIDRLPVVALLAGFIWPLIVIALKLLGRALLGMDRGMDRPRGSANLAAGRPPTKATENRP